MILLPENSNFDLNVSFLLSVIVKDPCWLFFGKNASICQERINIYLSIPFHG
jgi:hypothetical protein